MLKSLIALSLSAVVFYPVSQSYAADNLKFSGTLTIPNCTINNGTDISVKWDNVEIQTFTAKDTPYHEKNLDISLQCPYDKGTPKMKITASTCNSGGKSCIQTTKYNEGLVIYLRTKTSDSWVNYGNYNNISADSISGSSGQGKHLTMYASLGRIKEMQDLKPGPFTAGATLEVRYE